MNAIDRIARMFSGSTAAPAPVDQSVQPADTLEAVLSKVAKVVGFDFGKSGRRLAAIPSNQTTINALVKQYGARVIARSRYLAKNNPYAAAAKETFVSALAGAGIKPSTLGETAEVKKAVQELWLDWAVVADADEQSDFYGLQNTIAGELFEAGECFAVLEEQTADPDLPAVAVRLYQSEMLPYAFTMPKAPTPGNRIEMGIEFDPRNKRVAYHFYKRAPGEVTDGTVVSSHETVRIPAERVMHIFRPINIGQMRGVPHTLAGMVTLAMLDLYDDAELERKRTAALFAAFVTRNTDEEADSALNSVIDPATGVMTLPRSGGATQGLEPGAVIPLEDGENVEFSEPADVGGQYEAFQYRQLLRAAAGFGVPYANMTGDLKAVNYSSIRAGLVEFRRKVETMQHNVLVFKFCRVVWNAFLDAATVQGLAPWTAAEYRRNRRLHRRVKWLPPKWDWVDPVKDRQAEKIAVDNGWKSRSDVIEAEGYDPEETDERILADQERAKTLGIELGDKTKPAPTPPAPGTNPGEEEDEEEAKKEKANGEESE
jgi:lambda family phage portal protein